MSSGASASGTRGTIDVACDESGFVGGSLFGGTRAFTHAGVHVDLADARDLIEEVRRRTGAGTEELKASRLNRAWAHPVATWLCAADGPLGGRVVVHVTDTRLFGLARLAQVVMAGSTPDGWWSAREEAESWDQALRLNDVLADLPARWEGEVLLAARNLLWLRRRRRHGPTIEAWTETVRAVTDRLPEGDAKRFLAGWASADAVARAHAYVDTPPASPLSEPLLPALRWAVRYWSSYGDVSIVHDEQSVLTPARVAAIADELATACPGRRLVGFTRVDSRDDARVQLADLVAGVVRRTIEDQLSGGGGGGGPVVPVDHLVAADSLILQPLQGGHRASRKNTSQSRSSVGTS